MNKLRKLPRIDPLNNAQALAYPTPQREARLYVFFHRLGPLTWVSPYTALTADDARVQALIMCRIVHGNAAPPYLELIRPLQDVSNVVLH